MSPVGGSKSRGTRTSRAAGGILVALASEFWGLGCPRIYNEVATLSAMESWNHSFKVEAIHGEKFATRAIAKNHVFEYIEIYYNRKRLHSMIGYKSPELFEVKMVA